MWVDCLLVVWCLVWILDCCCFGWIGFGIGNGICYGFGYCDYCVGYGVGDCDEIEVCVEVLGGVVGVY